MTGSAREPDTVSLSGKRIKSSESRSSDGDSHDGRVKVPGANSENARGGSAGPAACPAAAASDSVPVARLAPAAPTWSPT